MAQRFATVETVSDAPQRRDSILDHFDNEIRNALDRADYAEVYRLAGCALAYDRSLWRRR